MADRLGQDSNFINQLLFSGEPTFSWNGHVNHHNSRYWWNTNPHWMDELHTQYPQKINVWCGIIGRHIVGFFFINGNLTSDKYPRLSQQSIIPQHRQIFPNYENPNLLAETIWFQQDLAPPHFGCQVRHYLNEAFPGRWIGRREVVKWPARSPDLTPFDFFLWVKNRVYVIDHTASKNSKKKY